MRMRSRIQGGSFIPYQDLEIIDLIKTYMLYVGHTISNSSNNWHPVHTLITSGSELHKFYFTFTLALMIHFTASKLQDGDLYSENYIFYGEQVGKKHVQYWQANSTHYWSKYWNGGRNSPSVGKV